MTKIFLFLSLMVLWSQESWATTYCTDASIGGCWLLNESSGSIIDSSGNGYSGSAHGSPTYSATGKFGTAITFNGTPDYFNMSYMDSLLKPVSLPVTLMAWVKTTSISSSQIIYGSEGQENSSAKYSGVWLDLSSAGKPECSFGDNGGTGSTHRQTITATAAITANTYYHVACVINGASNMTLYINGSSVGSSYSGSGGSLAYNNLSADYPQIGNNINGTATPFTGTLDEVAQFNRALTSTDINNIMNNGLQSTETVPTSQVNFYNKVKIYNDTTIY